jgi:hypothetical protein
MLNQAGQFVVGVAKSPTFWFFAALVAACVYACR